MNHLPNSESTSGIIDPRDLGQSREFKKDIGVKPLCRWRIDLDETEEEKGESSFDVPEKEADEK